MLKAHDIAHIDLALSSLRLTHNMTLEYKFPLRCSSDWKAKHFRLFVLYVGLPIVLPFLTELQLSHFALYPLGTHPHPHILVQVDRRVYTCLSSLDERS